MRVIYLFLGALFLIVGCGKKEEKVIITDKIYNASLVDNKGSKNTKKEENRYFFNKEFFYPISIIPNKNTYFDINNNKKYDDEIDVLITEKIKTYSNLVTFISIYISQKVKDSENFEAKLQEEYEKLAKIFEISDINELKKISSEIKDINALFLTYAISFSLKDGKTFETITNEDLKKEVSNIKNSLYSNNLKDINYIDIINSHLEMQAHSYVNSITTKTLSFSDKFLKVDTEFYTPFEKDKILKFFINTKKNEIELSLYNNKGKFIKKEKTSKYTLAKNTTLNVEDEIWKFTIENNQIFLQTNDSLFKLHNLISKVIELYDVSMIKNKTIFIKDENNTFSFMEEQNNRNYLEINKNQKKVGLFWDKVSDNRFVVLYENEKADFASEENIITFDFIDVKIEENAKIQISYYDEVIKDFKVETKTIQKVSTLR
ncbi:hypothetical protein [Malaciobacter mytili]|uniref:hypothetical protein n=1 Tax=Malaciobacter mytili TaxID=603050 RepID=UPI003A83755D